MDKIERQGEDIELGRSRGQTNMPSGRVGVGVWERKWACASGACL